MRGAKSLRRSPSARCAIPVEIHPEFRDRLRFSPKLSLLKVRPDRDVQCAAVRARNILRKLAERGEKLPDFPGGNLARGHDAFSLLPTRTAGSCCCGAPNPIPPSSAPSPAVSRPMWRVTLFDWRVLSATSIHEYPVLSETDREKKIFLSWVTDSFAPAAGVGTLGVLGIQVPEYM